MKTPARKAVFAKKSLGQNFLVDNNAIQKIVAAVPEQLELLLEIGPGRGALSTQLFPKAKHFCVLEKDDIFAENIGGTLFIHGSRNHHVFHADALEFDWNRIWQETHLPENTDLTVVANLPYNVATEILFRLFANAHRIPRMILMFQKEVGVRIAAPSGSRNCGVISVAAQNIYAVKVQQVLKPGAFRPSPKVDSVVLEFDRLKQPVVPLSPEELPRFTSLVKAAFAHRRKTLENSLAYEMGKLGWVNNPSKELVKNALAAAGIDGVRRAETLTVQDFGNLFRQLQN